MNNLVKGLLFIGLCFTSAACSVQPDVVKASHPSAEPTSYLTKTEGSTPQIRTATPTTQPDSSATPTVASSPTPTQTPKSSLYQFEVRFDPENKELQVVEQITYLNQTGVSLENIPMVVPPNLHPGQFFLNSLTGPEDQFFPEYELEGQRLSLKLSAPLQTMETLYLKLDYSLNIPAGGGVLGYTERQINVCDWYAFIPPYQENGNWIINPYSPIGEYLVYDVADFEVKISPTTPDPLLIIAAGAPAKKIGNNYFYTLPAARTFAWSASREYQLLRQAENPTVVAYVFPEHVDVGWHALAASISALNLFSNMFGAYPHQALSLVEGDFPDGMEYDGLFFVGASYFSSFGGGEENYLTIISVHETAHQWWFACVGSDSAKEPWLDESIATYSELLYYKAYYPGDEEWWWDYRVHHYSPTGWVDQNVYGFNDSRQYINAIYLRGALFLDQIRQSIGTEAFYAFLIEYCHQGKDLITTQNEFFELLGGYTTINLRSIIHEFFRNQ